MFENLSVFEAIAMLFGLGMLFFLVAFVSWILFWPDRHFVSDEIDE